jgi:transcriptional regulator with XRE-family HTH domain
MDGMDLKLARVRAGVTQARVAALCGISQTVLYAIEAGKRATTASEGDAVLKAIELAAQGISAAKVSFTTSPKKQ